MCVVGLIDFGDLVWTWLVNELAITSAYVLISLEYESAATKAGHLSQLEALQALAYSYCDVLPLSESEWRALPTLIACRLAMSLTLGTYSASKDPENEYLKLTLVPGWKALSALRSRPATEWTSMLRRQAC